VAPLVNLLYAELLKLKRAKMLLVSLIGAASAPLMVFIGYLNLRAKKPQEPIYFQEAFGETNLYLTMLLGTMLYGVITAYLFQREYAEDTLKHMLTIPISRLRLLLSKLLLLFLWITLLTLFCWLSILLLGTIAGYDGLSLKVMYHALKQYVAGGWLMFLLTAPTMLVTLWFKNYVPTIIFTAALTMGNVAIINNEYVVLYPWSVPYVIATGSFNDVYPPLYSYVSIAVVSIFSLILAAIYFKRSDIH